MFICVWQILEDGRLSDSSGRVVSFKNTLLIMTSNVGSSVIAKGGGQLGFALPSADGAEAAQYGRIRSLVMEELKVRAILECTVVIAMLATFFQSTYCFAYALQLLVMLLDKIL